MDDELERFKRYVDLTELAASLGYQLAHGQRATAASVSMRQPSSDDKIVIRRDADGHWTYFSVRDDRDNGSVVDFLQRRRPLSLGGVRKELRSWLREERPQQPIERYRPPLEIQERNLAAVAANYSAMKSGVVSQYLVGRGVESETLRDPRFALSYRVDQKGNVIFPHCHPSDRSRVVGYEIKNRGFSGFASGGRKTYWLSSVQNDDLRLVIVEGSIDALSYHQLFPDPRTRYLSTGGAIGADQLALIGQVMAAMPASTEIVSATDNDVAGDKLHERLATVAGRALVRRHASPITKDWNDYLRARNLRVER